MFLIQEKPKDGSISYIKKYISTKQDVNYEIEINFKSVTIKANGFENILIYDLDMNVIRDIYKYLNKGIERNQINSRNESASALKLLLSYIKIFNADLENMKNEDFSKLIDFLYGYNKKGSGFEFELTTLRSSDTINQYLSVYRSYFKFLGIENKILTDKTVVAVNKDSEGLLGHTRKIVHECYTINEESTQNRKTVPMYLSHNKFNLILSIIKKEYSLREEIIVRLMYENGMRIGEVLGITLEDKEEFKIIIRNRLTDKWDQHAKGCMKVKSESTYETDAYNQWNVGYQFVKPKYDLLDKIEQYIDIIHGDMSKTNRRNYIESKADKVSDVKTLEGDNNYYLFLNKNGRALRSGGWNRVLRVIYKKAGCKLDKNVRKHNLNHRMRHGYAVRRQKEEGASILQLAEGLRHSNISSVMCYLRPTEEDVYNANSMGAEKMMSDNPNLGVISTREI